jgi:hypothetical protein
MITNSHENEALFRTSLKSDEKRIAFNEAAATYSPSFDAVMTVSRDRVSFCSCRAAGIFAARAARAGHDGGSFI